MGDQEESLEVEGTAAVEKVTVDEMLERHCGEFGWWQGRHFFLTNLAWILEAFHTMVMIFADREPDFRCVTTAGGGCYPAAESVCGLEPGSWEWVGGPATSTVAEWGLVCHHKFKVGLVQSAFFAGCFIGAGIFGHLSDSKLGRKGGLIVICALNGLFGCLTALSPNYWIYLLLRVLTGFSTGGISLCAFSLANEAVGPNKRGTTGVSTFYFFAFGIATVSAIAYFVQHSWRALYVALSVPSILFLFLVLPFVAESPRWYLVHGKISEANKLIHEIAESNGRHIPNGLVLALDEDVNKAKAKNSSSEAETPGAGTSSLMDLIRWSVTRTRLFLVVGISFSVAVVYYGLSLNVANLDTNLYLSVAVNALSEMPAFALTGLLVDRLGRKPLAVGTMCFSGVFCILGSVMESENKQAKMACSVLGIFGMAGTYNLFVIYAAELFPTAVRNAALGCSSLTGHLAAVLAPFVVVLGGGSWALKIFAACGVAGGLMCLFLPETLNQPMYDTIAGMMEGNRTTTAAAAAGSQILPDEV